MKLPKSLYRRSGPHGGARLAGVSPRRGREARVGGISVLFGLLLSSGLSAAAQVSIVVSDTAGKPVADAAVALMPAAMRNELRSSPGDASIDQVQKQFFPHVSVMQVGTTVTFPNSDNIRHQVYSFSAAKRFETKLYSGKAAAPVIFDKPGVVVLGCNIHDSMRAYVYVVDTPYFAKTDAQGRVRIGAPEGDYVLNVWHPRFALGRSSMSHAFHITTADQQDHEVLALDLIEESTSATSASITR